MKNLKFVVLILFSGISFFGFSQEGSHYNLDKNIALESYDLVSYFELDKPLKGNSEFQVNYKGGIYLFANAKNKKAFENNPEDYRVVYGGWCAYAMGKNGDKVEIDPLTYKVIDGELYLFYNKYLINTLDKWNKNEKELQQQADKNWQEIIKID